MNGNTVTIDYLEPLLCRWFAMCENMTLTGVETSFGYIPCCERCQRIALGGTGYNE